VRSIILTGFMGTGKSCVGKRLAARLGYRFVDLDEVISEGAGLTINDIFTRHGEGHFRTLEAEAVRRLPADDGLVVATGGGAVIDPESRRHLHSLGLVVNLTASAEAIVSRLQAEQDRPLLRDDKSLEKIATMLATREPYYADADLRVDTVGSSPEQVVEEILLWLKNWEG
jgi:shikimate kinase